MPDHAGDRGAVRLDPSAYYYDHLHTNQVSMPGPVRPNTAQTATPSSAPGPEPGTRKDPDRRRRSSRGSGGPEQARLPGNSGYARPGPHGQTMPGYRSSRSRTAISDTPLFGSNNSRSPNRNAYQSDRYPLSAVRRTSCSGACSCGWPADYGTGRFPSAVMASHL